jgi:hypothetical protein
MYHLGRRDPSLDLLALRIAGIRDDAQVGCTRAALPCCTVVHAIIVDRDRRYCLERDARRNGAAALVRTGRGDDPADARHRARGNARRALRQPRPDVYVRHGVPSTSPWTLVDLCLGSESIDFMHFDISLVL